MGWIWTALIGISVLAALLTGNGAALGAAVLSGAQSGVTLTFGIAGSICLWCGVGALLESNGITARLCAWLMPIISAVFPTARQKKSLARAISGNICANFLGLGNAATPMGIRAVKLMADPERPGIATDEMCRLVVLNTASIQLIPTNVAAIRSQLGAVSPFDILPAVWITSICSAGLGLIAAKFLGKAWKDG